MYTWENTGATTQPAAQSFPPNSTSMDALVVGLAPKKGASKKRKKSGIEDIETLAALATDDDSLQRVVVAIERDNLASRHLQQRIRVQLPKFVADVCSQTAFRSPASNLLSWASIARDKDLFLPGLPIK